jgi:hypothetical protein
VGRFDAAYELKQRAFSAFLRRFKAQIGLTPSEYLLRARPDASCMLLAATDLPSIRSLADAAPAAAMDSPRYSVSACPFHRPNTGWPDAGKPRKSKGVMLVLEARVKIRR